PTPRATLFPYTTLFRSQALSDLCPERPPGNDRREKYVYQYPQNTATRMIQAVLIDDEPLSREIIREYLRPYEDIEIVEECNDGFEGLKAITQWNPQLIFLDIQMPKITGFELLELIEEPPSVIFTTAFDEYAIKAFEANAVDYLLKPFSREHFDKAIQKWLLRKNSEQVAWQPSPSRYPPAARQNRVVVKSEGRIKIIPVRSLHRLKASGDSVNIRAADSAFMHSRTTPFCQELLDSQHLPPIHRSYLVSRNKVTRSGPYEIDSRLAVSTCGIHLAASKSG